MKRIDLTETRWFLTTLMLIFITLKLCGVIDWSWWWVASPFWIPLVLVIAIFAVIGGCSFIAFSIEKFLNKQRP